MDLSKLPKLSQTPKPPEPEPPAAIDAPYPAQAASPTRVNLGAEAWLSIAIGVIVLLTQSRFLKFLAGRPDAFIDEQGQSITYTQSIFFMHDLGLVIFAVALILDGILFVIARAWALWLAIAITLLACLLNLMTVVRLLPTMGLQIFPALAVAIGVYMLLSQWSLLARSSGPGIE